MARRVPSQRAGWRWHETRETLVSRTVGEHDPIPPTCGSSRNDHGQHDSRAYPEREQHQDEGAIDEHLGDRPESANRNRPTQRRWPTSPWTAIP